MKTKEIAEKDLPALNAELKDKQRRLFDLRTQAVTEKLEDPTQLGKARKVIARIKTEIRKREIAGKTAVVPAATAPVTA